MASGGSSGAGALRYIVMLKVTEKENVAKVAERLGKLANGMPGVMWNNFALNVDLGLVETNYDIVLIIDFPDKENYFAYSKHPHHVSVVKENSPLVAAGCAVQFSLA